MDKRTTTGTFVGQNSKYYMASNVNCSVSHGKLSGSQCTLHHILFINHTFQVCFYYKLRHTADQKSDLLEERRKYFNIFGAILVILLGNAIYF